MRTGKGRVVLKQTGAPIGATVWLQASAPAGMQAPYCPEKTGIWISCVVSQCLNIKSTCLQNSVQAKQNPICKGQTTGLQFAASGLDHSEPF